MKKLYELKERIERAKTKVAELNGKQQYLLRELKTRYNCNSIEDAKRLIESTKAEIVALEVRIKNVASELEEKYDI